MTDARRVVWLRTSMPWMGPYLSKRFILDSLRGFLKEAAKSFKGPFPLFDAAMSKIRVNWTSGISLGNVLRTAGSWNEHVAEKAWTCTCSTLPAGWPRVRYDAGSPPHVCARQSEIPWPEQYNGIAYTSSKTKLSPSSEWLAARMEDQYLSIVKRHGLSDNVEVKHLAQLYARATAQRVLCHWRVQHLCSHQVRHLRDGQDAATVISKLWVEITDHATHEVSAICPALALQAIHKTWEFGPLHKEVHFQYGPPEWFGFRDVDELLEHIGHVDCLPAELQPSRLFPRRYWQLPTSRSLPKASDPANSNSHRPVCNRSRTPTCRLDTIMCAAGLALLKQLDVSGHLDIDDPADVPRLYNELAGLFVGEDVVVGNIDADMKGCFTNVPRAESVRAVAFVVHLVQSRGIKAIAVPKQRSMRIAIMCSTLRRKKYYHIVPLPCLADYTFHHCTNCYAVFGSTIQRQVEGHPMGSAFSVFLQRCWCIFKEIGSARRWDSVTLRAPRKRICWTKAFGIWIALLELRYADDVSQTAVTLASSSISHAALQKLLRTRLVARYDSPSSGIQLEFSDNGIFIGLQKVFLDTGEIHIHPAVRHRFLAEDASEVDFPGGFQHVHGWHNSSTAFATLSGLASRAIRLSSSTCLAQSTLVDMLVSFFTSAGMDLESAAHLARKWDLKHVGNPIDCTLAVKDAHSIALALGLWR
eukprot:TRINITY_DN65698_c0_g1_i2.p1 TRINITY_DN65698_c0_g1~~TRINITY_DN65698_c0_g1_i2.p1  ORF type:complete len:698 (+),score=17.04 TRINITY_DN65698_c0_g1_i2:186-2279(+)